MTAGMLAMILAMGMTACANADTKERKLQNQMGKKN